MSTTPPPAAPPYRTRVAFHHTDAAGIVHFANYFLFAEEAETALLAALKLPGPREGMQYPRVSAGAEYLRPLHFGDEVEVLVRLQKLGRSSLHWLFTVSGPEGTCARLHICTARRNSRGEAAPYSPEERARLEALILPQAAPSNDI